MIQKLLGGASIPLNVLTTDASDMEGALNCATKEGNNIAVAHIYLHQCIYFCFMADFSKSLEMAKKSRKSHIDTNGWIVFFEGLAYLVVAQSTSGLERQRNLMSGQRAIQCLKRWAHASPSNFSNKLALLEGERMAGKGKTSRALSFFNKSIRISKTEGFLHEEGLAYERLGLYCCSHGNDDAAQAFFAIARDRYQLWGSKTVVLRIEDNYLKV
jgi:tetratricopeptide (TPR) repeat protein